MLVVLRGSGPWLCVAVGALAAAATGVVVELGAVRPSSGPRRICPPVGPLRPGAIRLSIRINDIFCPQLRAQGRSPCPPIRSLLSVVVAESRCSRYSLVQAFGRRALMQLTQHTDYALRTLLALGSVAPEKLTVAEISEAYGISSNHLLKVVQTLAALELVETVRGKSGGVRLRAEPAQIRIGQIVRQVEPELGVVACLKPHHEGCAVEPICTLKDVLDDATGRFIAALDEHTLEDLLRGKRKAVVRLLRLGRGPRVA